MENLRMKIVFLFFLSAAMLSAHAKKSSPLKPFLTDYCTAYYEGTRERPGVWKHCCLEHDLYFWAGGSRSDRQGTDFRLGKCVEATGEVEQARLMYAAVALGGLSPIKFRAKHFGNAWDNSRPRYIRLTSEETQVIIREVERTKWLPQQLRDSFIRQLLSRLENDP
jgi:hypothetical protein